MSKPVGVGSVPPHASVAGTLAVSELRTAEDLAGELPVLDLLTLRIQLEKSWLKWQANGLEWECEGIGLLASNSHGDDLITTELLHNIMILSDTLNRAVHGEDKYSTGAAEFGNRKAYFGEIGSTASH
jgi:hypothetical protein